MLTSGNIIHFIPFYFKNGKPAKTKYFLVICSGQGKAIIASLPSSKDYVPSNRLQEMGCCEIPDADFNCFIIEPHIEITECNKCFPLKTYLYGHELDSYDMEKISEMHPIQGVDYEIWGIMKEDVFKKIIECFLNSDSVRNKFKEEMKKAV